MRILALLLITVSIAKAQTYKIGLAMGMKMEGKITITDSTFTFQMAGATTEYKIKSKGVNSLYIIDGEAVDQITYFPMNGKLKGFTYNTVFNWQQDKRFKGNLLNFFCKKEDN